MKVLIIDNYDSFTYNLYHLIEAVMPNNFALKVKRNDEISINEIAFFDKIVISPGPGLPKDAGISCETVNIFGSSKSILGVCLGHQAIVEAYGGKLINLSQVLHGVAIETCLIPPVDKIFVNCPLKFETGRYHSWVVNENNLPQCINVIAKDVFDNVMAIRHKNHDVVGVQFHPESILTGIGKKIINNWLIS